MGRMVGGIGGKRLPTLQERQALKSEISIDPSESCSPHGEVCVKEESRPVYRSIVIELNRPLKLALRLDWAAQNLFLDGVVKQGGEGTWVKVFRKSQELVVQSALLLS